MRYSLCDKLGISNFFYSLKKFDSLKKLKVLDYFNSLKKFDSFIILKALDSLKKLNVFDSFMILFIAVSIILSASYFPYTYISLSTILTFALIIMIAKLAVNKQPLIKDNKRWSSFIIPKISIHTHHKQLRIIDNKPMENRSLISLFRSNTSISFFCFGLVYIVLGLVASKFQSYAILEVSKIVFSMLFFIAILISNKKCAFFKGIWVGSFIVSAFGFLSYFGIAPIDGSVYSDNGLPRMQSLIGYANTTALILCIGYYITFYYRLNAHSKKQKLIILIIEYFFLACIMLTFSKLLIASFVALSFVQIYLTKRIEDKIMTALEFPILIVPSLLMSALAINIKQHTHFFDFVPLPNIFAAIKPSSLIDFSSLFDFGSLIGFIPLLNFGSLIDFIPLPNLGTLTCRLTYMKDALTAIFENPFSGIGAGAWLYKQEIYQSSPYMVKYIHNGLLQIALDSGITPLLLFIITLALFYIKILKRIKTNSNSYDITLFLVVTIIMLHSIMDINLSFPAVFNILAGCFAASLNQAKAA